jgi:hypothetical protein
MLDIQTRLRSSVSATPLGDCTVFDIDGGSFEGSGLRGQIAPSGGDWLIRTATGSRMDVRMVLQTDDSVTILLRYTGRASQRDGNPHIEIVGSFDAPEGRYAWLNQIQAFGLGTPTENGVRYHLYRFK